MTNRTEQFVSLVNHKLSQAKDSFARHLPEAEESLRTSLKKMGLVSRTEFEALEARVAKLEEAAKKSSRKAATTEATTAVSEA